MDAASISPASAADVNRIASFLAHEQVADLSKIHSTDCIVLCGSAILHCAETVYSALQEQPTLAKTLVICGGIGHSTQFLYNTIAKNIKYQSLDVQGLPESRVLCKILNSHFDDPKVTRGGCEILVEDQSTNCGANAVETRKILEANEIPTPRSFTIVQDPTMSLRTIVGFRKVYSDMDSPPEFISCPSFTPKVRAVNGALSYANTGVDTLGLWDMNRFCDLLLGEIPRLRDNKGGYGPAGKGFIAHVDIPEEVEEAWSRLSRVTTVERSKFSG